MGILTVNGKIVTVDGKPIDAASKPTGPYFEAEYGYFATGESGENVHLMKKVKLYNHKALMAFEFYRQTEITEFDYSDTSNKITTIEQQAFCSAYVNFVLPNAVKKLQSACFSGALIDELTVPSGVKAIPTGAFNGISGYQQDPVIILPDGLQSIGDYAFQNSGIPSITIPNSVTSIGTSAFSHCYKLTSLTIPQNVTTLGSYLVARSSITTLSILANITSIPEGMAESCESLTALTMPDTITTIGEAAFAQHHLSEVTIPAAVTSIGARAFWKNDTSEAWTVTCLPTTPPTISNDIFGNATDNITIKVPSASVAAYKAATNWAAWADHIVAIS